MSATENFSVKSAIDGIGNDWELDRVEFKPYPCAGALQATVRACVNLHNGYHFEADDIVDVECRLRMGDSPVQQGREHVFSQQTPQGEYGAHFSTPFIAAVALLKGRLALADFDDDALRDPEVLNLSSRIRREDDPNSGRPKYASGHVFVKTNNGKLYEERQHIHPGHVENPVSWCGCSRKYLYNALRLVSQEKAQTFDATNHVHRAAVKYARADRTAALLEPAPLALQPKDASLTRWYSSQSLED